MKLVIQSHKSHLSPGDARRLPAQRGWESVSNLGSRLQLEEAAARWSACIYAAGRNFGIELWDHMAFNNHLSVLFIRKKESETVLCM